MAPDAEIVPIGRHSPAQRALPVAQPLRRAAGEDSWWTAGAPSTALPGAAGTRSQPWSVGAAGETLAALSPMPGYAATVVPVPMRPGLRHRPSARVLRRRRAVAAALVVGTLVVLLALPVQAFAGQPAAGGGSAVAGGVSTGAAGTAAGAGAGPVGAGTAGTAGAGGASGAGTAGTAGAGGASGAGGAAGQSAVVAGGKAAGTGQLHSGAWYVVRPGDTLWSIATRLNPSGDPRTLVTQLEAQVGGRTLVAGEQLRLP